MAQSITISSGLVIQMAVDGGGLDIPAPVRHAAIQGSIVCFPNLSQSSAPGPALSRDVVAAAVERINAANLARNLKRLVPTEAAGDVMRRDYHIPHSALDQRRAGAGKTTRGLFP